MTRIIFGLIFIVIGLSALFGGELAKYAFALILIIIGLRIISRHGWEPRHHWYNGQTTADDFINEVAVFGPLHKTVRTDNFKGGNVVVVFGEGEVDLSRVKTTAANIDLEFVAVFGRGRLIVPPNWQVKSRGVKVIGDFYSRVEATAGETTLNVKGSAVFGSVEITN